MTSISIACGLIAAVVALFGVVATRIWRARSDKQLVRRRLEALFAADAEAYNSSVVSEQSQPEWYLALEQKVALLRKLQQERKTKQANELEAAGKRYIIAIERKESFDPEANGFDFSTAEIG